MVVLKKAMSQMTHGFLQMLNTYDQKRDPQIIVIIKSAKSWLFFSSL